MLRPLPRFDPGFRWPKGYAYIGIVPLLMMQGVFVGITGEIPFRALFLDYLLAIMPQRISVGRTDIS